MIDQKALEAAARAVDRSWFDGGPAFENTETSYQAHCRDTAKVAIEAYLSKAAATPSRNEVLEEAARVADKEAAKRKANADACERGSTEWGHDPQASMMVQDNKAITAMHIAAAIRALKVDSDGR